MKLAQKRMNKLKYEPAPIPISSTAKAKFLRSQGGHLSQITRLIKKILT